MAETLDTLWRRLLLFAPGLPPELAKHWVQNAFQAILRYPHLWSWAWGFADAGFPDAYSTGTIDLTLDSPTVAGNGTSWTSAHVGLQLKTGGQVFTITAVGGATSLTLDRAWSATSASTQTYKILRCYFTAPTDMKRLHEIVDVQEQYRLLTTVDRNWVDSADPDRAEEDRPRVVVPAPYSTGGLPRFEVWPHPVAAQVLPYIYYRIYPELTGSLPHTVDGSVLESHALAQLCRWPGTPEKPNMMFSRLNADDYERQFQEGLIDMARDDSELHVSSIWSEYLDYKVYPMTASYIQSHGMQALEVL